MAKFAQQFRKKPGEYGLWIVEETGLCLQSDVSDIESGCTKRYKMVPIPNSAGAVMKVLDGTNPAISEIVPLTYSQTYNCVKISGQCEPYAPSQDGGPLVGQTVLFYTIEWQQVGGIV